MAPTDITQAVAMAGLMVLLILEIAGLAELVAWWRKRRK
jgi:hypothetical protein